MLKHYRSSTPQRLHRISPGLGRITIPALAITLLGIFGCGDDGSTGPRAGTLEVSLTTPNSDDAAMVFRVSGPDIGPVTAADAGDYLHVVEAVNSVTVVLVGGLPAGALIRFPVADTRNLDAYTTTLVEVADDSNELRESLDGYRLTIDALGG